MGLQTYDGTSPGVRDFSDRRPSPVIADDTESLREILTFKLTTMGYCVRCAEDGESGWEKLSEAPFDLLITDYEMPGLTGLDLLRRMRESSLHQPAILMSGNLPQISPELEELLSPGAALTKPFSFEELNSLIKELLEQTRSGTLHRQSEYTSA